MNKGIRLWVDDLRDPADFGRPEFHWVKSNTEAIRVIDTYGNEIDEVSLDYDICHTLPGDSTILKPVACAETFEATARFLVYYVLMHKELHFPVTLHTSNPEGARKMENILLARGEDLFTVTHKYGGAL